MRLARTEQHPEREGLLHVFECTQCKLPVVMFSPPVSIHFAHRGYDLYAVHESDCWNVYVYPMRRGMPELTADQQLVQHPEQEDALAIARNRIDEILASQGGPGKAHNGIRNPGVARKLRYYFHVRNGRHYPDPTGLIFASADEAIEHAAVLAGELAQDQSLAGFSIFVTNESGSEIAHVPVWPA
jgi:hypothetical protein